MALGGGPLGDAVRGDVSARGDERSAVALLVQRPVGRELAGSVSAGREVTSARRGRQAFVDVFNPLAGGVAATGGGCRRRAASFSSASRSLCLCFSAISSSFLNSS